MAAQEQSPLMQLPVELQLAIFEYAVVEPEPLLLNCGCDSSYSRLRGRRDQWEQWGEDKDAWEKGEKHAPLQPGLTRTCKAIRAIALPMFYEQNSFRGHYCQNADLDVAIRWLDRIGRDNRRSLRDCCFWDFNSSYDRSCPNYLSDLKKSDVV